MISWPCGRRSIGNSRSNRAGSSPKPPAISGVSEEVAQVSNTSGSPAKPPGRPRSAAVKLSGASTAGSIGRRSALGAIGWSRSTVPSGPIGYHSGTGTPEKRCRLTSQSPVRPSTQSSKRRRMNGGCQSSSRPLASRRSRWASSRMNHWRLVTISSGWSPFS